MNFREFIGLDSHDRDRRTGKVVEHREKYRRIIEKLGGAGATTTGRSPSEMAAGAPLTHRSRSWRWPCGR